MDSETNLCGEVHSPIVRVCAHVREHVGAHVQSCAHALYVCVPLRVVLIVFFPFPAFCFLLCVPTTHVLRLSLTHP